MLHLKILIKYIFKKYEVYLSHGYKEIKSNNRGHAPSGGKVDLLPVSNYHVL